MATAYFDKGGASVGSTVEEGQRISGSSKDLNRSLEEADDEADDVFGEGMGLEEAAADEGDKSLPLYPRKERQQVETSSPLSPMEDPSTPGILPVLRRGVPT